MRADQLVADGLGHVPDVLAAEIDLDVGDLHAGGRAGVRRMIFRISSMGVMPAIGFLEKLLRP